MTAVTNLCSPLHLREPSPPAFQTSLYDWFLQKRGMLLNDLRYPAPPLPIHDGDIAWPLRVQYLDGRRSDASAPLSSVIPLKPTPGGPKACMLAKDLAQATSMAGTSARICQPFRNQICHQGNGKETGTD